MNLKSILTAFRLPKIPSHTEEDKKVLRKNAVKRAATGNINLQTGYYLTEEDIIQAKKNLTRCKL